MNIKRSLRSKLVIGFIAITLPLFLLLLYNNYYAMNTVREQVADSNKNSIILYSSQIEAALNKEIKFLYNFAVEDPNIAALSQLLNDGDEYVLAKARILNSLTRYHRFDNSVDLQFIYSVQNHDLFNTPIKTQSYDELQSIQIAIQQVVKNARPDSPVFMQWKAIPYSKGKYALIRLVDAGDGFYLGAFVQLKNLMIPLDLVHLGEDGYAGFLNEAGELITSSASPDSPKLDIPPIEETTDTYQAVKADGRRYIVVQHPIQSTELSLGAFIPEARMLQNLYHFRRGILMISVLAVIVLIIYLIYLNDIILKPMNSLIRGMRSIKNGNLAYRLKPSKSKEFMIINETFNNMASEIQELKISVYEEQIKAHKAELKHLQLQINPHFLLNSINIVYNLAQIQNYGVIQLMCLNLVQYFRFATRTNQVAVTMAEEMEHLESYIRIQQVRFPDQVTYACHLPEELAQAAVPPLLIQPFVENAIKHGFDFMDHPFHIDIRIDHAGTGELTVVIADNGAGFDEETLQLLRTGAYMESRSGEHLGITNVLYRLKHFFGSEAGLSFGNAPEGGAVVTLTIPHRRVEEFAS